METKTIISVGDLREAIAHLDNGDAVVIDVDDMIVTEGFYTFSVEIVSGVKLTDNSVINEARLTIVNKELTDKIITDKIEISWSLNDIYAQAEVDEVEITEEQAREVLYLLKNKHDAELGISWDVISSWIAYVVTQKEEGE